MAVNIGMTHIDSTHIKVIRNDNDIGISSIQSFTDKNGGTIEVHYHDTEFMRMVANELLNAADSMEHDDA